MSLLKIVSPCPIGCLLIIAARWNMYPELEVTKVSSVKYIRRTACLTSTRAAFSVVTRKFESMSDTIRCELVSLAKVKPQPLFTISLRIQSGNKP